MTMDTWGQCLECERWFYCGKAMMPTCPVCGSAPAQIEERASEALDGVTHA